MSCEIRSMMTAYFCGSSIRTPPTCTNSAVTSSTFIELIFSTTAGGNVFSIPNKIPIFFTNSSPNQICHPERSDCFAKRSTHAVEGPLHSQPHHSLRKAFSQYIQPPRADYRRSLTTSHWPLITVPKNTSPPYSATTASHASNYLRKHPASAVPPFHSESPTSSRSNPGKYPNPPIPAQSSSAGSGSKTSHHSDSANNPEGN